MELRHLRYFIGVAEELSFSRAARRLNISQPPLTQAIQQLEEELEVRLLDRNSRRVELTEEGEIFLSRSRSVLAQLDRTMMELRSREKSREVLRVGLARSMSILPEAMKTFRERFGDVRLELMPSVDRSARDFLTDDEADLNVGEYHPPNEQLNSRLWAEMRLLAIVPTSHALAGRKQIGIAELSDEPLLFPSLTKTTHMGREALRFCREAGHFEPRVIAHCDDMDVFLSLIASGAGIGISHGFHLNKSIREPTGLVTPEFWCDVPFRERTPVFNVGAVWRRDRESEALLGLVEALESRIRVLARKDLPGRIHYFRESFARSVIR